jgi:hypothetical protein
MYLRSLAISIACVASACHSAEDGERRAAALVEAAQEHLRVPDVKRTVGRGFGPARRNLTEVRYENPTIGRFATYYLGTDGVLVEFVVNQPVAHPYVPIKDRVVFIERMMEIAAPSSSRAERAWGAKQLDSLWTPVTHPLQVQVGDYVFSGITGGAHDTLRLVAADTGVSGLKYRPRP